MLIKTIKLNNYRNYSKKFTELSKKLNIITGNNGVGKTNLLESIIVVSNSKSFRTLNDSDLIKKDAEFARIEIVSDAGEFKVVINRKNKSMYINDVLKKKTSEYIGKLNAILFKPGDLELFNQAPSERRRILDIEISKVSKRYIEALLRYNYLIKDKNRLLKELEIDDDLLNVINESLVPNILTIIQEREKFFRVINTYISIIYKKLSGKNNDIRIIYKKCADISDVKQELENSKDKDKYYHYASFGPHHDDFIFMMDDYELNSIASQGQKRMVMISFKLALLEYIKESTGIIPIVLLDDIMSELDKDNQERLIKIIPSNTQVIITTTDINNIKIDADYKLIQLKEEEYV